MNGETVGKIIKENITFSHQVEGYVIHGAIQKIMSEHYKVLNKCDDQFNCLVECCNELADAAAGHNLGKMNDWLDKYANEDFKINWRKIIESKLSSVNPPSIKDELVKALQNMLNRFSPYGGGDSESRREAIQQAEEAISKATE